MRESTTSFGAFHRTRGHRGPIALTVIAALAVAGPAPARQAAPPDTPPADAPPAAEASPPPGQPPVADPAEIGPPPATATSHPLDLSRGEPADDFFDALVSGTVKLDVRLRAELADRSGLDASEAYTVRTRLGYLTQPWQGFQAMVEMEDVHSFDDDRYNDGLNGMTGKTLVADPEGTELNQLWASWELPPDTWHLRVKPGRQSFTLDDHRFIGNVGWRQDDQTYDAAVVGSDLGLEPLEVTYGYLWKINRIFSDEMDRDSDSHVINARLDLEEIGALTAFAYLLDFEGDSPMNSSRTWGVRLTGSRPLNDRLTLGWAGSVAWQEDWGDNPVDYDAPYWRLDASLGIEDVGTVAVGWEVLGSDDGRFGFRTPLATGHKFNGFADVFLVTPADGLEDLFVSFRTDRLPLEIQGLVAYHVFSGNDRFEDYGQEIDAYLTRDLGRGFSAGVKYSYFFGDEPGFASRSRVTFDLTFAF